MIGMGVGNDKAIDVRALERTDARKGIPSRFLRVKTCVDQEPVLKEVSKTHWGACHFVENYQQAPITKPTPAHLRDVIPVAVEGGDKSILATAKEEYRA